MKPEKWKTTVDMDKRLIVASLFAVAAGVSLLFIGNPDFLRNESDPADGSSGLIVLTDCFTGIQYLSTRGGGLTLRESPNGEFVQQWCDGVEPEIYGIINGTATE